MGSDLVWGLVVNCQGWERRWHQLVDRVRLTTGLMIKALGMGLMMALDMWFADDKME